MNALLISIAEFELPEWLTVGTLGTVLSSIVLIIVNMIKTAAINKLNKTTSTAQTSILSTIVDKLGTAKTTMETAVDKVSEVLDKVDEALQGFKDGLNNQQNANMNLAKFVLECFNQSNLSDEKKAKLQMLCDQIFYADNNSLIEALKSAKLEAERAQAKAETEVKELKEKLDETNHKLEAQQSTVKKSRRI